MVTCKLCHKSFHGWKALVNHKWKAHRRTMLKGARKGLAAARKARRGNPGKRGGVIGAMEYNLELLDATIIERGGYDAPENQELIKKRGQLAYKIEQARRKNPCGSRRSNSTRASIKMTDGRDTQYFYRHSDGYPKGTMPTLTKFMDWVKEGRIRNNVEQAAGWLVVIGAEEELASYPKLADRKKYLDRGVWSEPGGPNASYGWKHGSYEICPDGGQHGDLEYRYVVDLANKTITAQHRLGIWTHEEYMRMDPKFRADLKDDAAKGWLTLLGPGEPMPPEDKRWETIDPTKSED